MKKLIISAFLLTLGNHINAQSIENTPYSVYGIGDVKYDKSIEIASMGGISTAYVWDFNNQFNFQNPAANRNLELTSIKFQVSNENHFYKANGKNQSISDADFSGISIAFPLSKSLKAGLNFTPYSVKDYTISQETSTGNETLTGEGSINLIQLGIGYSITPELSLGLSNNFYFGKVYDKRNFLHSNATLLDYSEVATKVTNFNFTLGTVYQKRLKDNKKLTLGATYTLGNTSDFKTMSTTNSYSINGATQTLIDTQTQGYMNTKNILGQKVSVGVGFGQEQKWFISSQVDYKQGVNSPIYSDFTYENSYKVAVGGWYLPNFNNFRNYFSRITYRYGAFYEKGNLRINATDVNRYGLALGASFPFQNSNINSLSSVDLGIELGQRGTVKNGLIRENFINVSLGINFANRWFEKQLYD